MYFSATKPTRITNVNLWNFSVCCIQLLKPHPYTKTNHVPLKYPKLFYFIICFQEPLEWLSKSEAFITYKMSQFPAKYHRTTCLSILRMIPHMTWSLIIKFNLDVSKLDYHKKKMFSLINHRTNSDLKCYRMVLHIHMILKKRFSSVYNKR